MAIDTDKKVMIDWRGILLIQERKGVKTTAKALAEEYGVTTTTLANWDKEAPPVVQFIFNFCKNTGCTFEELVKQLES